MTTRPGYLGALARAGQWLLAEPRPDDSPEDAHPRPRSRFEPDHRPGDDEDWGEQLVETAVAPVVEPPAGQVSEPATAASRVAPAPLAPEPGAPPPPTVEAARAPTTPGERRPRTEWPAAPRPASRRPPPPLAPPAAEGGDPTRQVDPPRHSTAAEVRAEPTTQPAPSPPLVATPTADAGPALREPADEARPVTAARPTGPAVREEHRARPLDLPAPTPAEELVSEPDVPGPSVTVQIDRIEVRLGADPIAPPQAAPRVPTPGPSLDDYLQHRAEDRGRPA